MGIIWLIIILSMAFSIMYGLDIVRYRNAKRKQCRDLTEAEEVEEIFKDVGSEKGGNNNG